MIIVLHFLSGLIIGILLTLAAISRFESDGSKESKSPISANNKPTETVNVSEDSSAAASVWTPGKEGLLDSLKTKVQLEIFDGGHPVESARAKEEIVEKDTNEDRQSRRIEKLKHKEELLDTKPFRIQATLDIILKNAKENFGDNVVTKAHPNLTSEGAVQVFDYQTGLRITAAKYDSNVLPYPPLLPYHAQSYRPPVQPPYIPSLESVVRTRSNKVFAPFTKKALPNMTFQRAPFEKENLKIHLCNAVFEAYSASYLTTTQHILAVKSEGYNLSWVNCEMASFVHMRESNNFYTNPHGSGMIIQTLDVLDFSAIHLSAFERSSKKYRHRLWKAKAEQRTKWTEIEAVKEAARKLDAAINPTKIQKKFVWTDEAKRTIVIMPFLGGVMGAGHSELGNRFEYLKACFWSVYEFMPNIVAGVTRKEDVLWAKEHSGLPFYDILLLENLPKSSSLPLATVRATKKKLASGEGPFEFVFFTESDQIIISRILPMLHDHLKKYPRRMILPHRLMPYSDRVIREVHGKAVDRVSNNWMTQSCCLPRQNCVDRKSWRGIAHNQVPVINYYGLYVPLGNVNFLDEQYRPCDLGPYIPDYCP